MGALNQSRGLGVVRARERPHTRCQQGLSIQPQPLEAAQNAPSQQVLVPVFQSWW